MKRLVLVLTFSFCILASSYSQAVFQRVYSDSIALGGIYSQENGGITFSTLFQAEDNSISYFHFGIANSDSNGIILWQKKYGVGVIGSITQSGSGEIYGCGWWGGVNQNRPFIVKVNKIGEIEWYRQYQGLGLFYKIIPTSDSCFVIAGLVTNPIDQYDIIVMKISSSGVVLWSKTFGGDENEGDNVNIQESQDGGFFISTRTSSFGVPNIGGYLVKISKSGVLEWSKDFTGYGWICQIVSVEEKDGEIYIAMNGADPNPNFNYQNVFLAMLDSARSLKWVKSYSGGHENIGSFTGSYGFHLNNESAFFLCGSTDFQFDTNEVYIVRTNLNGDIMWGKSLGVNNALALYSASAKFLKHKVLSISHSNSFSTTSYSPYLIQMDYDGRAGCNTEDVTSKIIVKDITQFMQAIDVPTQVGLGGNLYDTLVPSSDFITNSHLVCYCDVEAHMNFSLQDSTVTASSQSQNYASLQWDFGDGSSDTSQTVTHTYRSGNKFTLVLTARNGDCFDTVRVTIDIPLYVPPPDTTTPPPPPTDTISGPILIPNIFVSGKGELFVIKNLPAGSQLYVTDMLGQVLFFSSNYQNNWGYNVSAGAYYYVLTLPVGHRRKGMVIVLR